MTSDDLTDQPVLPAGRRMTAPELVGKVEVVRGTAAPLPRSNVDTDQIVPAEYCKRITRTGYADALFAGWRTSSDCFLSDARYVGASILIAGANFGIGSSREHAAWALRDYGFLAIIAPSFSDIFASNAVKNGLVTVVVPLPTLHRLWTLIERRPREVVTVDVVAQQLYAGGASSSFDLPSFARARLLRGGDDIAATLAHEDAIASFEQDREHWLPTVTMRAPSNPAGRNNGEQNRQGVLGSSISPS